MIALYKYILEVNAKEEEELFQLKDNADTKANGHHKRGMQKPRWEVRSLSGIAAGRLRSGGSGSGKGAWLSLPVQADWAQQPWACQVPQETSAQAYSMPCWAGGPVDPEFHSDPEGSASPEGLSG